jgi:hypothetical protein
MILNARGPSKLETYLRNQVFLQWELEISNLPPCRRWPNSRRRRETQKKRHWNKDLPKHLVHRSRRPTPDRRQGNLCDNHRNWRPLPATQRKTHPTQQVSCSSFLLTDPAAREMRRDTRMWVWMSPSLLSLWLSLSVLRTLFTATH